MRRALYVAPELGELFSLRLRGRGEGRGVMVLDEAHYWLNARNWGADDREAIVTFFTQHRKLGWDVYLIVQDAEMIDKQVRRLIEFHVELKNLRRVKVCLGLLPLSPVNLFLANWWWHGMRHVKPVKRELNRLTWQRRLYDTTQLHHGIEQDGDADALWLPRQPDDAGALAASASESAGAPVEDREPSQPAEQPAPSVARDPAQPDRTTPVTVLYGARAAAAAVPPGRSRALAPTPSSLPAVDAELSGAAPKMAAPMIPANAQKPGGNRAPVATDARHRADGRKQG
jgi:hypothetical protein